MLGFVIRSRRQIRSARRRCAGVSEDEVVAWAGKLFFVNVLVDCPRA